MGKAKYYAVKHKKSKRWSAYKLTDRQLKSLHADYEYSGPYTGLLTAMMGVKNE